MMKDPDVLCDAIREAVKQDVAVLNLDATEAEALSEMRVAKTREICSRWFDYGEYLIVEIDTSAGTCVVIEGGR